MKSLLKSPWSYFLATFIWTWSLCGILIFSDMGEASGLSFIILILAMIGPGITGIWFTYLTRSKDEVRAYWQRVIDVKRLSVSWLAIAIGLPFALQFMAGAIDGLAGGIGLRWGEAAIAFISSPVNQVLTLCIISLVPFFEELGWRGYAQDVLQEKHSALAASLILGVVWSLWHLPASFIPGTYQAGLGIGTLEFWLHFAGIVVLSIVVSWIYINTNRSILIMVIFHAMVNLAGELIQLSEFGETIFTFCWGSAALAIALRFGKEMRVAPGRSWSELKMNNSNTTTKIKSSTTNQNDTQYGLSKAGRSLFMVAVLVAMSAGMAAKAAAGEKGWDYTAGIAVLSESVYVGSGETYVAPLPTFRASYTAGALSYYISLPLEGIGMAYQSEKHNVIGSLTLNMGGQRASEEYSVVGIPVDHSDETRAFLEDSPDVETPVFLTATLQRPMNIGIVGASVAYHPTSVEYAQGGIDDKVKHGLLVSLSYMKQIPITKSLSLSGMFSMEFMDDRYAEAWYGVERETASLDTVQAKAGLRDAQIAIHASYNISERVALSLYGANMVLLGDAEDSPYTVEQSQQTFMAELVYRF